MKTPYRAQISLLIPLAKEAFSPYSGPDEVLRWSSWEDYLGSKKEPARAGRSLIPNPQSQPWIRLPDSRYPGTFRRHIENFLYPGMAERRQGRAESEKRHIPQSTRRWIGLPENGDKLQLSIDISRLKGVETERVAPLEASLDAAEVFEADLGPKRDIYGPIRIGLIHFSIEPPEEGQDSDPESPEWNHAIFKATIGLLQSEMSKVKDHSGGPRNNGATDESSPLILRQSSSLDSCRADVVQTDYAPLVFPLSWLVRTIFGTAESSASNGHPFHKGTHFAAMGPPLAIGDRREYDQNIEEEGRRRLTELSSLSRSDSSAESLEVTSRIYASASRRGTALLNKGSRVDDRRFTTTPEEYASIDGDDFRNFRSYWIQGLLLGMVQHQALKRFSAELGTLGGDVQNNLEPMTDIYEAWLEFRNVAWWADLTYESPPADRLLESFQKTHHSQRIFEELEGDLETYINYASRKQDEATNRKLTWLQVGGVGLVVLGGWGAIVDIGTRGDFTEKGEVITSVLVALVLAVGTALLLLAPRR